jgi:hypothetical protein
MFIRKYKADENIRVGDAICYITGDENEPIDPYASCMVTAISPTMEVTLERVHANVHSFGSEKYGTLQIMIERFPVSYDKLKQTAYVWTTGPRGQSNQTRKPALA